MGIDEVNLAGGYRCVITNLATNNVFDMLEHRTQEHLKPFFKDLPDADKVEWVCTDMWRPFKRSFAQHSPNAKLVIDSSMSSRWPLKPWKRSARTIRHS
ncbi:Putative transposase (identified by ISEscan HMM) [Klebsiella pneumoniae]|nr:Putative transposase (identified by ISEscan HMM) [Klebsiella pneumoniae]